MLEWVQSNQDILSLALQLVMAVIWVCYLQLIFIGVLRQRRPIILVHRSGGKGDTARCLVSNMGAEPIYLINLVAELSIDKQMHRVSVIEKDDEITESGDSVKESAQGPIQPGEMQDVGSFGSILRHAARRLGQDNDVDVAEQMRILAMCVSGQSRLESCFLQPVENAA